MSKKPLTVVTGGASGIGAACVRHHVKRGDKVIVMDLASAWSDAKAKAMGVEVLPPDVNEGQAFFWPAASPAAWATSKPCTTSSKVRVGR